MSLCYTYNREGDRMVNNFFTICSFFYSLMLTIIYFKRENIKSIETRLYSRMIITNILNVTGAILCAFTIINKDYMPFLNDFVGKSLLLLFITWELFFTTYIIAITRKASNTLEKDAKRYKPILIIFYAVLVLTIYCLPLYYHNENNIVYSYGPSANLIYALTAIIIISWIIIILKNHEILKSKKSIPVILFIVLTLIVVVIQKLNPGLLLITATETFITVLMYFTIENPDMKLLEEAHRSKVISDSANEEKTLFVYNLTQEIRNLTGKINDDADAILDSKDYEEIYDVARDIKAKTSEFTSVTNDILDVGTIDSANLKTYENKYSVKNIIKQMVNVYGDVCKNKELKFRTNIDHDIPDMLYGDGINLKEVLNTILDNSTKYTNSGFVEFNVNTIIKNDICRLIFTVEDSGTGIKSEDINKIKVDDKSLSKANKLITMMNGTMLISSDYGVGTKVKVILDQKIGETEETEVSKYESVFDNISILSVDDSESGLKIIEKLLKGTNIKLDLATTGKECLDMIKIGKYDLILLDEALTQISGAELMQKMKEIRNFDTPVILLTKDNSYEYNEEYLKLGFVDYILKPLKKEELLEKIDKYTKEDKK